MKKGELSFAKIVGIILAVIVLILLIIFSNKLNVLKDILVGLFKGFGDIGG